MKSERDRQRLSIASRYLIVILVAFLASCAIAYAQGPSSVNGPSTLLDEYKGLQTGWITKLLGAAQRLFFLLAGGSRGNRGCRGFRRRALRRTGRRVLGSRFAVEAEKVRIQIIRRSDIVFGEGFLRQTGYGGGDHGEGESRASARQKNHKFFQSLEI